VTERRSCGIRDTVVRIGRVAVGLIARYLFAARTNVSGGERVDRRFDASVEHPRVMTELHLSRRTVLATLGTIGVASAGAGIGTSAVFGDRERFENNRLTAGEVDTKVGWESHYSDWSEAEAEHAHVEDGALVVDDREGFLNATRQRQFPDERTRRALVAGDADPCETFADVPDDIRRPLIDLTDVKPGDFGLVTFDVLLCDTPGYVWLTGALDEASENRRSEPEPDDPDEEGSPGSGEAGGAVELLDTIRVRIWYDEGDWPEIDDETLFEGTLAEALDALRTGSGIPLDGARETAGGERDSPDGDPAPAGRAHESRACFEPEPTLHGIGFEWKLPTDHGNEVQSDGVTFDLGFYTEQCRHNDGAGVSDGRPIVTGTRFDVLDERGSGERQASVTFDDGAVIVTGIVRGDNGCYTARLGAAVVDDGRLVVDIESYEDAPGSSGCTGALVFLEYEAVVELRNGPPASVRVEHDGERVTTEPSP
jgi:hypothetical protein